MSIDATVDALANPSSGQTAAGSPLRRLPAREPVTQTGTVTRSAVSMPVPATDSDLIDAIADRHQDALEVVLAEYSPGLYSLACRMCGPTLAGEIVETVFVNLWTRPSQFQPDEGSLARFLLMATHRQAVHLLRDMGARRTHDGADLLLKMSSSGLVVDRDALQHMVGDGPTSRLAILNEDEHNVIVLAYFGGYTCTELAALLGQHHAAITRQICSGLRRLREPVASTGPALAAPVGIL